jgi:hypothetical protein
VKAAALLDAIMSALLTDISYSIAEDQAKQWVISVCPVSAEENGSLR